MAVDAPRFTQYIPQGAPGSQVSCRIGFPLPYGEEAQKVRDLASTAMGRRVPVGASARERPAPV